jgi:hypothetical protein
VEFFELEHFYQMFVKKINNITKFILFKLFKDTFKKYAEYLKKIIRKLYYEHQKIFNKYSNFNYLRAANIINNYNYYFFS